MRIFAIVGVYVLQLPRAGQATHTPAGFCWTRTLAIVGKHVLQLRTPRHSYIYQARGVGPGTASSTTSPPASSTTFGIASSNAASTSAVPAKNIASSAAPASAAFSVRHHALLEIGLPEARQLQLAQGFDQCYQYRRKCEPSQNLAPIYGLGAV